MFVSVLDLKDFKPTSSVSCLLIKLPNNSEEIHEELKKVYEFQYKNFAIVGGYKKMW